MILRIAFLVLLAVVTSVAVWFGVRSAGQTQTIARLENELSAARAVPPQPSVPAGAPGPAQRETAAPRHVHPSSKQLEVPATDPTAPLKAQVQQLTAEVVAAQAQSTGLQLKVDELITERDRLSAAETQARDQIAELRSAVDGSNSERSAIESKLRTIEAEAQALRQQSKAASQRTDDLAQSITELQDVLRRQQTYVNNVVSRYREITDILRAPAAPAGSRDLGPDLVRAGNLISMTDEDLRAVRDLNARLALIQKRLMAAAGRKITP
jgi:chromosome segregation ATPase